MYAATLSHALRYSHCTLLAATTFAMLAGVPIQAVCVMLPSTADEGETLRRKLYADTLAQAVCAPPPPFESNTTLSSQIPMLPSITLLFTIL
jgi:hypothetical protein